MLLGDVSNSFETFGRAHVAAMAIIALMAVAVGVIARKASPRTVRILAWTLVGVMLAGEAVEYAVRFSTGPVMEVLRRQLPLHLCDGALLLTAYALVRRSGRAFEVAYFWALAGTLQAILMPDLTTGWPDYWFAAFFIGHGAIMVGVVLALVGLKLRPRPGAVWRVAIITNVFAIVAAAGNWLLGGEANYMYLCRPPDVTHPLFFLPWPWYIAMLEVVAAVQMVAFYAPWYFADRRSKV